MLTKEDIAFKLQAMEVGEGKESPFKSLNVVTVNPDYDPSSFSQEIEDSEEEVDLMAEIQKETAKPGFDWVWNNTLGSIKRNSEAWCANHSKKCKAKLHPLALMLTSVEHADGKRDYFSPENVERVVRFGETNGEILEIK